MNLININLLLGYVELHTYKEFKDNKCYTYSYGTRQNHEGEEVSRTEPSLISILHYTSQTTRRIKDVNI